MSGIEGGRDRVLGALTHVRGGPRIPGSRHEGIEKQKQNQGKVVWQKQTQHVKGRREGATASKGPESQVK